MNTIQYIVSIVALIGWITLMSNAEKIRNSKYWFVGFIGSLFLLAMWAPMIMSLVP